MDWRMALSALLLQLSLTSAAYVTIDNSSDSYISLRYCGLDESCKSPYDTAFSCKCLPQYVCAARSATREAFCTITVGLGHVWLQPSLAEGKFVLDTPSGPGKGRA